MPAASKPSVIESQTVSLTINGQMKQFEIPVWRTLLVLLSDQPELKPGDLQQLVQRQAQTQAPFVASSYANTLGPPDLFMPKWLPALSRLQGDQVAKALFQQEQRLQSCDCAAAARDIDTRADAERLLTAQGR